MTILVPDLGSWTLESIEIEKRTQEEFRQGFIGAPAAARGSENKLTGSLARSWRWGELVP